MTAQELKNSILQLAVQGKLVPQCKEDEPASELLKRIRADKEKVEKKEKPLPEIIPVKRERAEEAPPIIKPKNTPPPKDDDTRNMCIMCGVGISKAVAAISNRKVQQTVCLQCREKILKGRYKK